MVSLAQSAVGDGARALVVDDEPVVQHIISAVLEQMGYEVDRASDGDQALDLSRGAAYDVVVCDLLMPRVNGMALYERWQSEAPEIARRIVFVTGDSLGSETSDFLSRTGCRCIYKPFRLNDLTEVIAEMRADTA